MLRLAFSFCVAIIGHLLLLQLNFGESELTPPQLISDNSVNVTLNRNEQRETEYSKATLTQNKNHSKQEVAEKQETSLPKKSVKKSEPLQSSNNRQEISRITPQVHKIAKTIERTEENIESRKITDQTEQKIESSAPQSATVSHQIEKNDLPEASPVIKASPLYQHNPKPEYPALARRRGWEGIVLLLVEVTEEGYVASITLEKSCGHTILDNSALRAVKTWRFLAGRVDNKPITSTVRVPIHFKLQG